ncbi:MAG: two-component system response regulator [Dehalococcoidia bacterium]|nr:two-component system response regulator [Dehalococcoidia bacterium]
MAEGSVLVVDDEPGIVEIARVNLESAGYRVISAGSGEEALELMGREHPDLVILEIMLPEMDGWQVLEKIERLPDAAGTPVIFLSALAEDAEVLRGLEAGAIAYITKPFYPQDLVASVRINLQVFNSELREQHRRTLIAKRKRLIEQRLQK